MWRPTKQRTAAGRLAWLDQYLLRQQPVDLRKTHVVDVGFGIQPTTCIETLHALQNWQVSMTAIDSDASSVEAARGSLHCKSWPISFQVGDFHLARCVPAKEKVGIIRCANVLRAYREDEVEPAWQAMASVLKDGGVLLDSTCDAKGAVGTCLVLRKKATRLHREALVFYTDFTRGFAPRMFRDVLPRVYRRRAKPGSAIACFLDDWHRLVESLPVRDVRDVFDLSVQAHPEMKRIAAGLAHWIPEHGVPLVELP